MVDFEGGKRGGFEPENGVEDSLNPGSNSLQEPTASGSSGTRILAPDASGVVVLPEGVSLEDIVVVGRDLVINLADGSRIVIPDGAIIVPQLVIDGVAVPPLNLAALLNDAEINPEAAPNQPPSSGGNFAGEVGDIQDAFDLGNLLPYTDLARVLEEDEEVIPFEDTEPSVVIETPENPIGVPNAIATVSEDGLPARGDEPEGTADETDSEISSGTIVIDAPDGLSAVIINGVEVTAPGQTITTDLGTLEITSIDLDTGEIEFIYTLEDNTTTPGTNDNFDVTVVDRDGDEADATLTVIIEDDAPIAINDANTVPPGSFVPVTGNVVDNDESGADGFPAEGAVTGFSNANGSAEPGDTLQGEYGTLTINPDGSYSYTRDFNTPGGVEESFEYTIVDQDGSTATAVLTITIEDSPADITFVPDTGDGTVVNEGGLPPRGDEPVGSGEGADNDPNNNSDPSENTGNTITFTSPDGVDSITINGVEVNLDNEGGNDADDQVIIDDDTGTLVITEVTYDPETGEGTITYDYTLGDNTDGDDTTVDFDIVVTDLDGDSAEDTVTITIVDDVPDAIDDSATQDAENAPVTVDVFANDVEGADGVPLENIEVVDGSLSGTGTLVNNGDGTFTYTPGPGEEGTVTFEYTITDNDGDSDTATVTIDLLPDSTPEIGAEGEDTASEDGLPARGDEPAGSNEASDSETTSGSIFIDTGNDTIASLVINGVDVTNGATVTTDKGELVVTEDNGEYTYEYTLTDNTLSDPDSDPFEVVVTDSDGDSATTNIVIAIIDDMPEAVDDANSIAAGEYGPIGGNVIDNDTQGADGAVVSTFEGNGNTGAPGDTIQGVYGTLTLNEDGTYTYVRDAGTPGGVTDTFEYTITDGDGDTSSANLVITIGDSDVELMVPAAGDDGTQVDEAGLDSPVGSDAGSDSEFTSGTITYNAPDGPATVTIGGVEITTPGQTITGTFGTMTITSVAEGVIGYTYELTTNTDGDDTEDSFDVVVTDQDGDDATGTVVIDIIDDVPTANPDSDSVMEDGPLVADGNVLTGTGGADANTTDGVEDVQGADGATVTGVAFGDTGTDVSGDVGTAVSGNYGELTINADGSYTYELDNTNPLVQGLDSDDTLTETFTYTITDGDTDTSTTTVTITVNGADDDVTVNDLEVQFAELVVDEDDLADGSSPDAAALTQGSSFTVDSQDGLDDVTIGGVDVVVDGVFVGAPVVINGDYGTLTITGYTPVTDAAGDTVSATFDYEYVLSDNTLDHSAAGEDNVLDSFAVVATDTDGSTDNGSLDVAVIDDVPTAEDDTDSISEASGLTSTDGNVITGVGTDSGAAGEDTEGADTAEVSTTGDFVGTYGTLTLNADGSYNYVLSQFGIDTMNGLSDGESVSEEFPYTLTDADGDSDDATLTFTLNGQNDIVTINDLDGQGPELIVDEDDLADGSSPDAAALTQGSAFTFTSPDGLDDVTIGGVDVIVDGVFVGPVTVTGTYGELTITGFTPVTDAAGNVTSGSFDYEYVLSDNTLDHTLAGEDPVFDDFEVVATDDDGDTDSAFINVEVVDDVPTAEDDTDSISEASGLTSTDGNVITGVGTDSGAAGEDTEGADTAVVSTTGDFVGTYGTLTLNADGSYNYVLSQFGIDTMNALSDGESVSEDFPYTLTDADGDSDDATLTFTLNGQNDIVTINDLDGQGPELLVDEDDLAPNGSDQTDSTTDGDTFTFDSPDGLDDVTIGGEDVVVDGVFVGAPVVITGDYGTLTITGFTPVTDAAGNITSGSFDYEYTITDNTLDHSAAGEDQLIDSFEVVANDDDGDSDTASLDVAVVDDVPTAEDDVDSVGEGETADGNLVTGVGGTDANATDGVADVLGADGAAAGGAVVDADFVSANQAITFVSKNVAGDGTITITTTAGVLTVNPDGTYVFDSAANSINGDAEIVFDYKIEDGDGDQDTATLTIDITNVAGDVSATAINVDEKGLEDGSGELADPAPETDQSEIDSGQITVVNATGPFVYDLDGSVAGPGANEVQIDGVYGTIVLNTQTGEYTYTLDTEFDHDPVQGTNVELAAESFTFTVEDTNGNDIGTGVINVNITDDIPSVELDFSGNGGATLLTQDAETEGAAFDTAAGSFASAFTIASSVYGADGPGSLDTTYDLTLLAAAGTDTGLDSDGANIFIYELADGTIVGSTSAVAPASVDASVIFSLVVNEDTGEVTLTQFAEIDHPIADDPSATEAPFEDQIAELASGLVGLEATAEIIDNDGDTATSSETLDLGGSVQFADDGPDVTLTGNTEPTLEVDETDLTTDANAIFAGAFATDFGADGAGSVAYTLGTAGGDSGLVDTATGQPVTLSLNGTVVEGRNTDGDLVFTVSVDATTGEVTLDQSRAVVHADTNDHDDATGLTGADLVTLTATATDGDGDTDAETIDLSDNLSFRDDGPDVTLTGNTEPSLEVDETDLATDATASFAGAFSTDFGEDGDGGVVYTLTTAGGASGLVDTATGQPVTLSLNGSVVEGRNTDGDLVFTVSVDASTGEVTLDQSRAVVHADTNDHDDVTGLTGTDLITLTATATDGDGDTDSESIDLSDNLTFRDDGPSIDAAVTDGDAVVLNTQDAETIGANTDFAASIGNFSGAFTVDSFDYGEDGAGMIAWDFSLEVTDAVSGLSSDGDPITLFLIGGKVVGSTAALVGDVDPSNTIFDIAVAPDGSVTLNQYEELDHPLPGDTSDYDLQELVLSDGKVNLVGEATITDGDGDTASETVKLDLGGNIAFDDDGPAVTTTGTEGEIEVDETTLGTPDSADFSSAFTVDYGADGAGNTAYTLGVVAGPSGLVDTATGNGVFLFVEGGEVVGREGTDATDAATGEIVFTVDVDATGEVTLTQSRAVEHPDTADHDDPISIADNLITLTATATDGDGDTDAETIGIGDNLTFRDDGPTLTGVGLGSAVDVDESDVLPQSDTSLASILDFTADFGADGDGGTAFTISVTDSDSGLATAVGDQPITLVQVDPTTIEGQFGAGQVAFTVEINTDGTLTVTQNVALEHEIDGDDSAGEHNDTLNLAGKISATVEITDGDGDKTSGSADVGGAVTFFDDGPSVTLSGADIDLTVADATLGTDAMLSFAGAFTVLGGEDGLAGTAYALSVTDGSDSGIVDLATGENVFLFNEGGVVVGRAGTDAADAAAGEVVFEVSVDGSGNVTLDQQRVIDHANSNGDGTTATLLADGLVQLTATGTDNDGDTASATLDIGSDLFFTDDVPTANAASSDGLVDEDGLTGGITDNGTNDAAGADTVATGSVSSLFNSGADAPLTYGFDPAASGTLPALTSDGVTVTYVVTATSVVATAGGDPVFTMTLNASTGAWEFTLEGPLDHATGDSENATDIMVDFDGLLFATDADGDRVDADPASSLTITIDDDSPRANADTDTVTEGGTETGNVLANDEGGADGLETPAITGIASVNEATSDTTADGAGNFVLAGEFGTLTLNQDGSYTYVSDENAVTAPGDVDVFEYTIIDNDGDTSTTTLTINITDVTLVADNDTVTVNEAGLDTIGSDAAANSETAGGALNVAGATSYALVGTGVGSNGTLTLNADGTYSYTLTSPVDGDSLAPSQGGDNSTNTYLGHESFDYIATDANGNTVQGTITVDVIDDVPTAKDDSDTIAAGGTTADGNVITGVGTDNPVTGEDVQGADQPVAITALSNAFTAEDDTDPTGDFVVNGQYGQLTLQADGSYDYARFAGSAGGVQDVFTYTIVDQDGDTSMATLTIDIGDLTPMAADGTAQLDDDGLVNANTAAGTNDIDADAVDMNGNEAIFTGMLGGSGGDGALSYAWTLPADTTIGQEDVTFTLSVDGLTLTAVINSGARTGTTLFEAQVTDPATGEFNVTLLENVLHIDDANDDEDGIEISAALGFTVTDVDGDSDPGVITVQFNDDVPTLGPIVDQSTTNEPTDPVIVGDLNLSAGADGLGELIITADVTGLTAGGEPLTTVQVGNVLTAFVDANSSGTFDGGDTAVFTITADPNAGGTGTYTFDLITPLDGDIIDTPIGGSNSFGAGPEEQGQALLDAPNGIPLSVVSGYNTNGTFDAFDWFTNGNLDPNSIDTGGVNGSTTGWGIDNNNLNQGQLFVWDFSSPPLENPDGAGGFEPPVGVTLPDVSYATFNISGTSTTDVIQLVIRYTDGTFESREVTGTEVTGPFTVTAPPGKFLDSVELYAETLPGGGNKTQLVAVGVQDESINEDIPVKITAIDGDGDMVMSEFGINVSDASVTITNLVASAFGGEGSLDEDDLLSGSEFPSDSTLLGGTFTISAPDGVDDLIVGGETVILDGAFVGGTVVTSLGTLNITGYDAGTGEVTYTYQLDSNADHSGGDVFDNFSVELTDVDGDADGDTLSVQIIDDAPLPLADVNVTNETVGDVNIMFILDYSGSVNNTELDQMLKGVEEAINAVFGGTSGDVTVRFVAFSHGSPSSGALNYGPFTDAAAAIAQLDALNPFELGSRPYAGRTNFTEAVEEAIGSFVPDANATNQIFFLSDGNPNEGLGSGGSTFTSSTSTNWNNFVNNNDISVTSIGIGNNINVSRLQDVDVDGAGAPIVVPDFTAIAEALLSEIRPDPVSGDLDGNDKEGADGARVLSIEVDGVTYTWDGGAAITPSNGDPAIAGTVVTVDTTLGGTLEFDFATGEYTYRPPNEVSATTDETFDYVLIDGDGSTTAATLTVTVQDGADVGTLSLGGSSFSAMSFSSSSMLLGDSGVPGGSNDPVVSGGGFDGGSTGFTGTSSAYGAGIYSFANDNFGNQLGMRSVNTSMLATAAFGALMVNSGETGMFFGNTSVSSSDAYTFAGTSSFEMVSMDSLGSFQSSATIDWMPTVETPVSVNANGKFGDHDAFTTTGMTELSDFGSDMFATNGVSEFLSESAAFDAAAPMMGGMDASGSMMEALLTMAPDASAEAALADVTGLAGNPEAPELAMIMDDIMAEYAVEGLLDQIAGPANEIVGMGNENGYLGNDTLAAMIDTGAFAIDGNAMADMTEEAAALATMSA